MKFGRTITLIIASLRLIRLTLLAIMEETEIVDDVLVEEEDETTEDEQEPEVIDWEARAKKSRGVDY